MTTTAKAILQQLRAEQSETNRAGMARFGINTDRAFGIPSPRINQIARAIGRDHRLALALWETNYREARLVAISIADPKQLTSAEMDLWTSQFDSWDICDSAAIHLFRKHPLAWKKAAVWSRRKSEFVRRAGFTMVATLTVHDKQAPDQAFLAWLPRLEAAANDPRNFVKKAVNWALRQIGKRNAELRKEAIKTAERLITSEHASARWIGSDARRELQNRP